MADLIQLNSGAMPWAPTPDSELVAVYNLYEKPLIGRIAQRGAHYIFQCYEGELEPVSLWAYTLVQPREVERLEAAEPDEFDAALERATADRPATVALSREGQGIVSAMVIDSLDHSDAAAQQIIENLRSTLELAEQEAVPHS